MQPQEETFRNAVVLMLPCCILPPSLRWKFVAGPGLHLLKAALHLRELNLKGCHRLTDLAMQELGQLTALEVLNLSSCWQITIGGLRRLSGV